MRVSRANVIRAVKMALIIGPVLTLINQTWLVQRLLSGGTIPTIVLSLDRGEPLLQRRDAAVAPLPVR